MAKMLVVDDELDVCDFVKQFFEERGYDVTTAYDGEEAISHFEKQKFDIVLLDMRMKKMDGLTTLKSIKKLDKKANVIMVTAADAQEDMDEACNLGACKYITKPLILEELESAVYEQTKGIKR